MAIAHRTSPVPVIQTGPVAEVESVVVQLHRTEILGYGDHEIRSEWKQSFQVTIADGRTWTFPVYLTIRGIGITTHTFLGIDEEMVFRVAGRDLTIRQIIIDFAIRSGCGPDSDGEVRRLDETIIQILETDGVLPPWCTGGFEGPEG